VKPGRLAVLRFEATEPAWSPDGRTIALVETFGEGRAGNLWIAGASGALRRITSAKCDGAPAWTADGRLVAARVSGDRFSFQLVDPSTGRARPLVPGRTFPIAGRDKVPSAVTFSPDGAKMAFDVCKPGETLDDSGKVLIMDLKTAKVEDLAAPPKSVTSHPTWSPDGRVIAYQRLPKGWYYNRTGDESYSAIWVTDWRSKTYRQVNALEKEISFVSPRWCPADGLLGVEKWLVSMKRESRREAWLVNAANTQVGSLLEVERRGSGGVAWAPDGRHYAFIASANVNGKFINELWTGVVSPQQRAAALKTQTAKAE
jgi:Tol biopolymer transport system component